MIYLVRNTKYPGALVTIFHEPGKNWDRMDNGGHVTTSVADEMVAAGIAQYDEPAKAETLSNDDEITLLPCPFCGGEAEIERMGSGRQSMIYSCGNCGCRLETSETFLRHHCAWNTRERNK